MSSIAKYGGVEPNMRAVKSWLSSLERAWLLIIDNADDEGVDLEEYIPAGERGFILITTRNPSNKRYGTLHPRFYVFGKLEADEATDLLLKAAERPTPWNQKIRKSAINIAEALGYLPLALFHAGKAIMDGLCTLDNYLEYFDRSWQRIRRNSQHARSHSPSKSLEYRKADMQIYSSYEVIYIGLEHREGQVFRDAAELLKMFSFLYRENIRYDILVAAVKNEPLEQERQRDGRQPVQTKYSTWKRLCQWVIVTMGPIITDPGHPALPSALQDFDSWNPFDEDRLRDALSLLTQLGLTMYNEGADSYSIHPLVHIWARERPLTRVAEQAIWCQAAANVLSRCILIKPPPELLELDEQLRRDILPHVDHVRRCQERIRSRLADNLLTRNRIRSWFFPLHALFIFGRSEALEYTKFSLVYSKNGEFSTASTLQEAVRDFLFEKLGPVHLLSIGITRLLAGTYFEQFRVTEAVELQEQAHKACLESLGPEHPITLEVKDTLGHMFMFRGQLHDAHEIFEEVVSDMTKILGPDHENTLTARGNLGNILWKYFKFDEALKIHLDVLDRMNNTLGATHLKTLTAKENVASSYLGVGGEENLKRALGMIEEVIQGRKEKLGKEQPYTLLAMVYKARIKTAMGQATEAESILRAAIDIAERNLGSTHGGVLMGKAFLSQALIKQAKDRYAEAKTLLNEKDKLDEAENARQIGEEIFAKAEKILLEIVPKQNYKTSAREDGEHIDRIQYLGMLQDCYIAQDKIVDSIRVGEELQKALAEIGGQGRGTQHAFAEKLAHKQEVLRAKKKTC
jgi:tetratricopeptide (TPR) repeat protein